MSETNAPINNSRKLIPVTQWPKFHNWPPVGGLRHLIFYENQNGFSACIVRAGRRVLIDEQKFFEWIDSQKQKENQK